MQNFQEFAITIFEISLCPALVEFNYAFQRLKCTAPNNNASKKQEKEIHFARISLLSNPSMSIVAMHLGILLKNSLNEFI